MPPIDRFLPQRILATLRERPLLAGGLGAAGGLLCGALAVAAVMPGSAPERETTGSAVSADRESRLPSLIGTAEAETQPSNVTAQQAAAGVDCQEQTWPYIARSCLSSDGSKRGVRVISTDRVAAPVISAIEARPATAERLAPAKTVSAPRVAPASNWIIPPGVTAPSVAAVSAAPEQQLTRKQRRALAKAEARARRQQAEERQVQDRQAQDTQAREPAPANVVERWTEREYNVSSDSGDETRRVVVRRPSSGSSRHRRDNAYLARATSTEY